VETKKLIEVALPLAEINDASAYDKMPGIGAHPKGIHHWWARLPLPVSRAVLFASVVDDPSSHPEKFPTEEAQQRERERLFGIIRRLLGKKLHEHPEIYAGARAEMLKYCDGKLPPVLDPFAGGGSIPLEAARFGMEAYAGDLNPVAVLLNKCYLELVPRWADWPPVNPEERREERGERSKEQGARGALSGNDSLAEGHGGSAARGGGNAPGALPGAGMVSGGADQDPSRIAGRGEQDAPFYAPKAPRRLRSRSSLLFSRSYRGAAGLAADLRYYGWVILQRARARIGHLYPPVRVTAAMIAEHPHLKPYQDKELPVIAWLWARTVPSPDPAAQGAPVPLMSTFWLSSKKGSEAWLEPVVDRATRTWRFRVRTGAPPDREAVKAGTKTGRAMFRCLLTGGPIHDDYIKEEGKAGRMDARLVAIVADAGRGRVYLPATEEHEAIARKAEPAWRPDGRMPDNPRWFSPPLFGLETFADLFTPRQLTAMVTLSDLVRQVRADVRRDALAAGLSDAEASAYADTVVTFLGLAKSKSLDFHNSLSRWSHSSYQPVRGLFGRQAIPMVWDFVEANPLENTTVSWGGVVDKVAESLEAVFVLTLQEGYARPIDAASPWDGLKGVLVSTDPPYYDNIGYAALSDFFYVWLRRTIGDLYPDLFGTILVPKEPELVAAPERFGGDKRKAKEHFEQGFRRAFAALREKMDPRFPLTVYYAFKQDDEESGADEEEGESGSGNRVDRTTGWETMLTALVATGFQVTATWPVRSAQKWRQNAMGSNALASYIVLACRPRPADAPQTDRRSFVAELKRELPVALRRLQQGNIAPVDFAQAAIGPGMAIYSRYRRILEASGQPMSVRTALALINQTLAEVLSEQEDEFDADTRWAIAWYEQHGFQPGEYGDAELLSKAKATSVHGLVEAGIVRARGGLVQLLRPEELPGDWDPAKDRRTPVWEATHHLVRLYWCENRGEDATAQLLRKLGPSGDLARELAYRLFHIAEKKGRSQDAQAYNALVVGWPELAKLAQRPESLKQSLLEAEE
jgi:putative DNA methylase